MNPSLLIATIGEMDTGYIVIAFIVIIVLWIVFKMINKNNQK